MPPPHAMKLAEWEAQREPLLRRLAAWCGPIPPRGAVSVTEDARIEFSTHTEIKVYYEDERGAPIRAYLLLPRRDTAERLPGIVAAHQCAWACDLGKEQVIGHCVDLPEQAYGLDLVRRGFVVIAPDANHVGERYDPSLRDRWQTAHVFGAQDHCCTAPGGAWHAGSRWKRVYDVMRAIDVLCAHPRVDPSRIGMIGHSLGADTTLWTMPFEPRIKAAAISCGGLMAFERRGEFLIGLRFADVLKLLAPRPFFESVGRQDWPNICPDDLAAAPVDERMAAKRRAYDEAGAVYAACGAGDRLTRYEFDGGHSFPAPARAAAYEWLERWLMPRAAPHEPRRVH